MSNSNDDAASKALILIVEDEAIIAMDIAMQLRDLGYEPLGPAVTGDEAIEIAGRLRPQLVLMDIHLDGPMDGIDAAQAIRNQFDIPCIFLSAFTEEERKARAMLANPVGNLPKPFTEYELCAVIAKALEVR